MSIRIEKIKGFTVTLKENLSHEDFKFFNSLGDKHKEFDYGGEYYDHPLENDKVALIVDGMCAEYARLVYIEKVQEVYEDVDEEYLLLKEKEIPSEVYDSLNKAYQMIYNEPLDRSRIEYALWCYVW